MRGVRRVAGGWLLAVVAGLLLAAPGAWASSSGWRLQTPGHPPVAGAHTLFGVSCPSSTACLAVGNAYPQPTCDNNCPSLPFAERWDGRRWTAGPTASFGSADHSSLSGLACRTASWCMAVGQRVSGRSTVALIERWNGRTWTVVPLGAPAGSVLTGIACPTEHFCTAVGQINAPRASTRTFVARWNGRTWTGSRLSHGSGLHAISCPSTSVCEAVGTATSGSCGDPEVQRWTGGRWTVLAQQVTSADCHTWLSGVSCPSASACTAVGYQSTAAGDVPRIWTLRGAALTVSTPTFAGDLLDVACASMSSCVAVGDSQTSSGQAASVVERGDGQTWARVPTPNPQRALDALLFGVACAGSRGCAAVGQWNTADIASTSPLIESTL